MDDINDANTNPLEPSKYQYAQILNTRLRTLGPRLDPELKAPQKLLATTFTSSIMIRDDPYDEIQSIVEKAQNEAAGDDDEDEERGIDDPGTGGIGGDFSTQGRDDRGRKFAKIVASKHSL